MSTVKINSRDFELKEVLAGISQLDMDELRQVLNQVSTYIARKKAPSLSKKEAELILKINVGLPEKVQQRYNELRQKLVDEKITDTEYEELLELTPLMEAKTVERLTYLLELATLWKTTVDDVMKRLDIRPLPPLHG